jgi:hypothetical protein
MVNLTMLSCCVIMLLQVTPEQLVALQLVDAVAGDEAVLGN